MEKKEQSRETSKKRWITPDVKTEEIPDVTQAGFGGIGVDNGFYS